MTERMEIPSWLLVDQEFFAGDLAPGNILCKVLVIFRDSLGDQHVAFEQEDDQGIVYVIHLGSNFFKGWTDIVDDRTE